MDEFESIETQLRQIAPRRPAASIAKGLFRQSSVEPQAVAGLFTSVGQWLVPVAGCLLLAVSSLTPHMPSARASGASMIAGGILQETDAYLSAAANFHSEQNNLPRTSLEWSLGSPQLSLPFPQPVTNTLRH